MKTLHLQAENQVIDIIMQVINDIAKQGKNIEILDNDIYNFENNMINIALQDEKSNNTIEHQKLWNNLLK